MFCVGIVSHITIAVKRPKAIVMEINNFKGVIVEAEVVAEVEVIANLVDDDCVEDEDRDNVDMFRGFRQSILPKYLKKFGIILLTRTKTNKS